MYKFRSTNKHDRQKTKTEQMVREEEKIKKGLLYFLNMEYRQLKLAIFVVWIILSGIIFFTLSTPFIFPENSIDDIVPKCEWKIKYNKECSLCGMTRGFIYFSQGNFTGASEMNKFSPFLYLLFVANETVLTFVLFRKFRKKSFFNTASFPIGKT